MYCSKCGTELPDGTKICPSCGENQNIPASEPAPQCDVVSVGDWMITILLTWIPIVGFVMMFVWGFGGSTNAAKKNWARASLIWTAIGIVLSILFGASLIAALLNLAK